MKSAPETRALISDWDVQTKRHAEDDRRDSDRSSDESVCPDSTEQTLRKAELIDPQQLNTELAKLIYKTGLMFDQKTELP